MADHRGTVRAAVATAVLAAFLAVAPVAAAWGPSTTASGRAEVWAVGDGAAGTAMGKRVGGSVAAAKPDLFLYLGDVYRAGTAEEFATNYDPLFGPLAPITAPVIGNHEDPNLDTGYSPYWQGVFGTAPPRHYALAIAGWELIALDSERPADPAQLAWIQSLLANTPGYGNCRIAFWHKPYRSATSPRQHEDQIEPLWKAVVGRARLVLNGHEHNMERFRGHHRTMTLISGAGGHKRLYPVDRSAAGLRFADDRHYGALRLRLSRGEVRFAFISAGGRTLDKGVRWCQPR